MRKRAAAGRTRSASPRGGPHREILLAAALLAAILAVPYGDVLFSGRSLVLSDAVNPFDPRYLSENYGEGFVPEEAWRSKGLRQDANMHDPGAALWQWEPASHFLRNGLLTRHELPFWDPYVAAGAPAMANLTHTWFFPPYTLVVLLGGGAKLRTLYSVGLLWAAGLATWVFLRRHGLGFPSALLGGAGFMLSGALVQNTGSFLGQTAACIPVALLAARHFLERPTYRRCVLLSAVLAAVALSSFPPILLALFGFVAAYGASALLWGEPRPDVPSRGVVAFRFALSCGIGVALVAWYYLPALAAMSDSPQAASAHAAAGLIALPLVCLFQLVSPVLMGGIPFFQTPPFPDPFYLHLPYAGGAVLALAALAGRPAGGRRDPLLALTAGVSVLVALKIVGAPLVHALGAIPPFRIIHFFYFGALLNFLLAVLAAFGLEHALAERLRLRRVLAAVAVFVVLGALLHGSAEARGAFQSPSASAWLRYSAVAAGSIVAALLGAALVSGAANRPARRRLGLALALGAVAAEGAHYASQPRQNTWDVYRNPPPFVRLLMARREEGRVLSYEGLEANMNSAFEIRTLGSLMAFSPQRAFELYRRHISPLSYLFMHGASLLPDEAVLDAANIRFLVVRTSRPEIVEPARERGYSTEYDDGFTVVLARRTAPRYFVTRRYRVAQAETALASLGEGREAREVLLEEDPGMPAGEAGAGPEGAVVVSSEGRNGTTLEVVAPRGGLLYGAEGWAPGWTARVGGKSTPILRANYAFRAIVVPPGRSVVRFSYWPPGLTGGLLVSVFGLGLAVALLLRRDPTSPPRVEATTRNSRSRRG